MQQPISRSCVTAGIALVSAGIVTVTPVTVSPMASAVSPTVALTSSYSDFLADAMANMDLDGVIEQVRLGSLTLGGLLGGLGLGDVGMGDLLQLTTNVSTLGDLLEFLGMGDLGLSDYSLTALLGLDTDAYLDFYNSLDPDLELEDFRLVDLLSGFGINPEIPIGLGQLLVALGDGNLADESLGSLLSVVSPLLGGFADDLLGSDGLEDFLNNFTLGDLVGGLQIDETVSSVLGNVGGALLSVGNLTLGGILADLGLPDSVGALTLGDLMGGLGGVVIGGPLGLDITGLLNGLDVGDLIDFLGLEDLPLNPGDLLGDWVNPYLGDLLEVLVPG